MICQKCGKHPATVHFTNIINGMKTEYYLCDKCAGQSDLGQMEIQDLISGFFGMQTKKGVEAMRCEFCQSTLAQIKKRGKAGCPQCYQVFASYLDPIVRKVHGSDTHVGKQPAETAETVEQIKPKTQPPVNSELETLQRQLRQAVAEENYEEAARLRDAIAARQKEEGTA